MVRSWVRISAPAWAVRTSILKGAGGVLLPVTCVLAVAALVGALCAAHRRKEKGNGDAKAWATDSPAESPGSNFQATFKFAPKSPRALINSISSKKLLLAKRWNRSEDEEPKAYDRAVMEDGGSLWQRTILMGERCQPPDFSGVIIYDHKGNRLPEFPPRSPKLNVFPPSFQAEGVQQR